MSEKKKTAQGEHWLTPYVRSSSMSEPSRQKHVLGVDFGETFSTDRQFQRATQAVSDLHEALALLNDTASELILLRKCADVCKVVHLLRAAAPSIEPGTLERSLLRCLGGGYERAVSGTGKFGSG